MTENASNNGKTVGLIAYFTLIGWIIALVMHNKEKTEFGAFHLRQVLGIMVTGIALSIVASIIDISIISMAVNIAVFVLWIIGLIGAAQGEQKLVPVLGEKYQEWFKGIG